MTNHIKEHWDGQAKKHNTKSTASWGDKFAIRLEMEFIKNHIKNGDTVLDVGCSNGHAMKVQKKAHKIDITGVDFSADMVAEGQKKNLNIKEGDVRNLPFEDNSFDVVYTTRTLINLPSWEDQKKGINECLRVCKESGTVLFLEAFWEPLCALNELRKVALMKPLKEPTFNKYIAKHRLRLFLSEQGVSYGSHYTITDFSSYYYLGSRFLRGMCPQWVGMVDYSNPFNRAAFRMQNKFPSFGGFGIQQAVVIKRKQI